MLKTKKKKKTDLYIKHKKKVQAIIRGEMHKYEANVTNDILNKIKARERNYGTT